MQYSFLNKIFKSQVVFVCVILLTAFLVLFFFYAVHRAYAQFNPEINYQGKLLGSTGAAVSDGSYDIVFKLYDAASGGNLLWTETRSGGSAVTVTSGLFSVMLGEVNSLVGVDFNQVLYLGVTVESDSEMTPRKILGTVPAAFVAQNALSLGGATSTQYLRSDQEGVLTANSSSTGLIINQNGAGDILDLQDNGASVMTIFKNGNVGLGSLAPTARLTLAQSVSGNFSALSLENMNTSTGSQTSVSIDLYPKTMDAPGARIIAEENSTHTFLTNLQFHTKSIDNSSGSAAERMRIDPDGKVGIGTPTPSELLEVAGNILASGTVVGSNLNVSNWDTAFGWGDHSVAGYLTSVSGLTTANFASADISQWTNDSGYLTGLGSFTTDNLTQGTTNLYSQWDVATGGINYSGGNVGIGTSTPASNLHVYNGGMTNGTEFLVQDTGSTKRPAIYLTNDLGNRAGFFHYGSSYSTYAGDLRIHMDSATNDIHFTGMRGVAIDAGNIDITNKFQVNSGSSAFSVTSGGNVGVGTDTPLFNLTVVGNAAADRLLATSLTVNPNSGRGVMANYHLVIANQLFSGSPTHAGIAFGSAHVANGDAFDNVRAAIIMEPVTSRRGELVFYVKSSTGAGAAPAESLRLTGSTARFSGNVGIGTAADSASLLHVLGTDASNPVMLKIQNLSTTSGSRTRLLLSTSNSSSDTNVGASLIAVRTNLPSAGGTNLEFHTSQATSMAAKMTLSSEGNLGIGTTSPTNSLSFGHTADHKIWTESQVNTSLAGRSLTLEAGSVADGVTSDINGGPLILSSGAGKGTGTSYISFVTGTTAASGSTLQTLSEKMIIRGTGNVGIGTSNPQQRLHVYTPNDEAPVRFEDSSGYCEINPISTTWSCASDERLKQNIETLSATDALDNMAQLRPVTFTWISDDGDTERMGLIAQEVEEIFPQLVKTDERGFKSVSYGGFTVYFISAIQELNKKIVGLFDGAANVFVKTLKVRDELCIDNVCINKAQLQALISQQQSGGSYSGGGSGPAPVPTPPPATSDPDPAPEPEPESTPEPAPQEPESLSSSDTGGEDASPNASSDGNEGGGNSDAEGSE